jgi:hypothetical protein
MGSSQGKELVDPSSVLYHHSVTGDVLDRDVDVETMQSLIVLASTYADEVIASLPENDPGVLQKGLAGAFLSFLGDATGILAHQS